MDRFYCPDPGCEVLEGAEAAHCLQVLRHGVGDRIALFDGRGRQWEAEIKEIRGRRVSFSRLSETMTPRPGMKISLVQCIPKAKAMDLILQKSTELGVSEIIPVVAERSISRLEPGRVENKVEKWRETVIEAAKQCGQDWLPEITQPVDLSHFLRHCPASTGRFVGSLHPGAQPLRSAVHTMLGSKPAPGELSFLIGPEGDLTPTEIRLAMEMGCVPVSLGSLVLRCDTAAIFVLSVLRYETGL